jgi:type I protein arginine methyltransferase
MFICDDGDELFYPDEYNNFPLSSHKLMLKDQRRLRCFSDACTELIRPGDVVVDAGTGTGILAFLAAKKGAKKVVGFDSSSIVQVAREIKSQNFPNLDIVFRNADLLTGRLPKLRADVIISETLGYFGIDEGIAKISQRLRRQLLKPNGLIIPSQLRLFLAPVESLSLYDLTHFWQRRINGIDFGVVEKWASQSIYTFSRKKHVLLSKPGRLVKIDLQKGEDVPTMTIRFRFNRSGILHGFVGWFEAQLSPNVVLSTCPTLEGTHWGNIYFPIGQPIQVSSKGSAMFRLNTTVKPQDGEWQWSGEVKSGMGKDVPQRFRMGSLRRI